MVLLSLFLVVQTPIDSVQTVTRDIPNFWRAYDLAAGNDSAERVRIFETVYLQPGSPGLRDWMRVRLMNRDTVRARLARAGWPKERLDSLPLDSVKKVTAPFYERSAAEELLRALGQYPRYYAAVRPTTLSVEVGPWLANAPRQVYGREHEHDVWVD